MAKNTYGTGLVRARQRRRHAAGRAARAARDGRLGDRAAARSSRSRRRSSSPARRSSGCATGSGSSRTRARPRRSPRRWTATTASTSCPRSPGLGSPHWDPVRARDDRRPDARHRPRAPRARGARGDRLPDGRRRPGDRGGDRAAGQRRCKADGGATANAWLMQFQADVLGVPVVVPEVAETTALGAALMAGVGAGVWSQSARDGAVARAGALRAADGRGRARDAAARLVARARALARLGGGVTVRPRVIGRCDDRAARHPQPAGARPDQGAGLRGRPRRAEALEPLLRSARSRSKPDRWIYEIVRVVTSLLAWIGYRTRTIDSANVPDERAADLRAEPLLEPRPLLHGPGDAAQGAVHGQVAALHRGRCAWIYTHGGVFPVRRGRRDERSFEIVRAILGRDGTVCVYCEGGRSRTGKLAETAKRGHRADGAGDRRAGRARRDRRVAGACATGSACGFPRVTVKYGEPMRWEQVAEPTRAQQQAVADEIFAEIKRLHALASALDDLAVGARSRRSRRRRRCRSRARRRRGRSRRRRPGSCRRPRRPGRCRRRGPAKIWSLPGAAVERVVAALAEHAVVALVAEHDVVRRRARAARRRPVPPCRMSSSFSPST